MSVVGFDLGNYASYVAVARHGGIDVLTNDYSLHATPTCVSFGQKTRVMGVAARQQVNTNFKNTVLNLKHLLGRKFNDPVTKLYSQFVPAKLVELPEGDIGFEVNFLDKKTVFTPEQAAGMFLHKMKEITEHGLGEKVNDCVISVPFYFADNQRRALLAAGKIAGLNVLRIVNENTAVGLAYGMYKGSQLPPEKEAPRIVAFVDVGHASVQASLMAFHERKVQVLGAAHDLSVGGLFFDDIIREQFAKEFQERYGLDAKSNPRAWQRLLDECEKLKKQMSANSTAIPLNIECFMNDKDVSAKMKREDFEKLAEPLFQKVRDLLTRLVQQSGVKVQDVSEVELIGGSSRIPYIRNIIAHIFNREPMTTMNLDEAVARGAAMQCAILSPSFKTKEFTIKDSFPFDIKLQYHSSTGQQEQVIFKHNDEFPAAKILTLCKKNAFDISAYYVDPSSIPYADAYLGNWYVECSPINDGERNIKVKFRVNGDGVFQVANAQSVEEHVLTKQEQEEDEKMDAQASDAGDANKKHEQAAGQPNAGDDEDAKVDGEKPDEDKKEEAKNGEAKADTEKSPEAKKPKVKKVIITHSVTECVPFKVDLEKVVNEEKEMEKIDLYEKRKADSKNALEEYCYNMRDALSNVLSKWVNEDEATHFQSLLSDTENWLYEDGEDVEKEQYDNKLQDLRSVIETPINQRKREEENRLRREAEAQRAAEEGAKNPQGEPMDAEPAPTATASS